MATVHLIVKGKVQGVFYRASARKMAETLGVTGWIQNTDDGSVEAMASGTEAKLQKFVDWCHQGPVQAYVTHVYVKPVADEEFTGFQVLR